MSLFLYPFQLSRSTNSKFGLLFFSRIPTEGVPYIDFPTNHLSYEEELKVIIGNMNEEMRYPGFYFKKINRRFQVYHTDAWHAEENKRRLEIDKLRKDVHHFDKMTDKMIKLVKKYHLQFEFENGYCVALVSK